MTTRKKTEAWIQKSFAPKALPQLERLIREMEVRLGIYRKKVTTSQMRLEAIKKEDTLAQAALEAAKRKLLDQKLVKVVPERAAPSTTQKTATQKGVAAKEKKKDKTQSKVPRNRKAKPRRRPRIDPRVLAKRRREAERAQELESLAAALVRRQFAYLRWQILYLKHKKLDEEFSFQEYRTQMSLLTYALSEAKKYRKTLKSQLAGGLWHRHRWPKKQISLDAFETHTISLVQRSVTWLQRQPERLVWLFSTKDGQLIYTLLWMLLGFVIFLWIRSWKHALLALSRSLRDKKEMHKNIKQLWKTLAFLIHVTAAQLYVWWWSVFLVLSLHFSVAPLEKATYLPYFLEFHLYLLLLRVISLSLHKDPAVRYVDDLTQQTIDSFRKQTKRILTLLYLGWTQSEWMLHMGYPDWVPYFSDWLFAAMALLAGLFLVWRKDVVLSFLPRESELGRRILIWTYRLYLYVSAFFFVVFAIYSWGYRVFAVRVFRGTLLSIIFFFSAYGLYRLFYQLVLWMFGYSRGGQSLFALDKKIARRIVRFLQVLLSGTLFLTALLLALEVWGISGTWKSVKTLIHYPLVKVQDTHVTPLSITKLLLSVVASLWISKVLTFKLKQVFFPLFSLRSSTVHAINTMLSYLIIVIGCLFGLQWMGVGIGGLAVFAGAIGIGVGFGLQNVANNFISGLLIIFGRPIGLDDVIEVGGLIGTVRRISTRSVTIETFDGRWVLVPNAEILTSKVINLSLGPPYLFVNVEVGVAYGTSPRKVEEILLEIANKHPKVIKSPPAIVRFQHFGNNSLDFNLWVGV
ncbi:MAG: mechanosensitive ion channel domain-containing protein, partial [Myxococcota bacterium]